MRRVEREDPAAGDVIALVQLRGEIGKMDDVPRDGGLAADFRDCDRAEFQIRAIDRKLTVRLAIRHGDLARDLDRAGDSVRRIFRPIIAQLNLAYGHLESAWL